VVLFIEWLQILLFTLLALVAVNLDNVLGPVGVAADMTLSLVVSTAYYVLVERITTGFRPLRPQFCSIYDPYYWWHERLWKVPDTYLNIFNGTPFKNVIWRLLGVRIGRRVFDDGIYLTERTLTIIGDDCTLNAGSKIQCHSLEDGTFKSDCTMLGVGCTLDVGSFVHYGVTMGDEAILAADSFLMKGEEVPAQALWGGNPAMLLTNHQISSVAQPILVPPVAHLAPSQAWEEQWDYGDERTELIPVVRDAYQSPSQEQWDYSNERTELLEEPEEPTDKIPVCRPGLRQTAPLCILTGGKTR
jgi:serine acetyltransferase